MYFSKFEQSPLPNPPLPNPTIEKGKTSGGGDTGDDTDKDNAVLSIVEGEEVVGVIPSTLAERRPELKRELGILRQALLLEEQASAGGGGDGSGELKVCVRVRVCMCLCVLSACYKTRQISL